MFASKRKNDNDGHDNTVLHAGDEADADNENNISLEPRLTTLSTLANTV